MLNFVHSGIIRTALPNMDREARQEYDVVIQAKDMGGHMGGLSGTTEVKITLTDVNDNPPKFPQSEYEHIIYLCIHLFIHLSIHPSIGISVKLMVTFVFFPNIKYIFISLIQNR